ncbi:MAG: exo-rhamnogalacturonan lyase family protein [Planctomycetota bacterium]
MSLTGKVIGVLIVMLMVAGSANSEAKIISLVVEEPSGVERRAWPVTSGVPLAEGTMREPSYARLHLDGKELPLQTETLSRWSDGSIKWLLLDFQIDIRANERRRLTLEYGPETKTSQSQASMDVRKDSDTTTIVTGPLKFILSRSEFRLFDSVWLDLDGDGNFSKNERVTSAKGTGIMLTDSQGKVFRADNADVRIKVEQAGPLRTCVRVEGAYAASDKNMFRYIVRIHAFEDKPYLRVFHTFINDWPDDLMAKIKSLSLNWKLSNKDTEPLRYTLGVEEGTKMGMMQKGVVRLHQIDDQAYNVNGKHAGKRAPGWLDVSGTMFGITTAFRDFWQNYPKGLSAKGSAISIELCPSFQKGLYDNKELSEDNRLYYYLHDGLYSFKVGVAKTHEMWLLFHDGKAAKAEHFWSMAQESLLATCEPTYVCSTGALGDFPPADTTKYYGYDRMIDKAMKMHLERREKVREYGLLNFGDWYGERSVNWGNLEYDLQHGLLLQYARTGDRRYYRRAEQAARHHIDVDVVHATNDHLENPWGRAPKVGDIWLHCLNHTGGYYEYGKVDLPVSRTYFMGHSTNFGHVWVGGDLEYYLFSGDRRALEVSLMIADAMIQNCPIPYGSGTHIRQQGWPMILLLHSYDVTGDEKYLKAADTLWQVLREELDPEKGWVVKLAGDHCRHGDRRCYGNVPFMEGLMLSALSRYHKITKNSEVGRAISVGIDQMIRECWEEDKKAFRYTACPISPITYSLLPLASEAMAYENVLTKNAKHQRVFREGTMTAIQKGCSGFGKSLAQWLHFGPYGLPVLE